MVKSLSTKILMFVYVELKQSMIEHIMVLDVSLI